MSLISVSTRPDEAESDEESSEEPSEEPSEELSEESSEESSEELSEASSEEEAFAEDPEEEPDDEASAEEDSCCALADSSVLRFAAWSDDSSCFVSAWAATAAFTCGFVLTNERY
jgi:hypothetical protein